MSYGERLKQIRKSLRLSQAQLGKQLGVNVMVISRLEKNETALKAPFLKKLDNLGIDIAWLLSGEGEGLKIPESTEIKTSYAIPIVEVQAIAGSGIVNENEIVIGSIEVGMEFRSYWGKDIIIIKTTGDSMEPTIPKNSWILVQKTNKLKSEGIFIFLHDNELRCKRIQRKSTGEIIIKSDNPFYETEVYSKETSKLGDLFLLGEVVGIMDKI